MGFYESRIKKEVASLLREDEKMHFFIRQSLLYGFTPDFVIATDKRILIIKNSFLGLYTGKNVFGNTSYNSIPYRQITSVILSRGISMCTVVIRLQGMIDSNSKNEGEIKGLWSKDAENLVKSIEHMVEHHSNTSTKTTNDNINNKNDTPKKLYNALVNNMDDLDLSKLKEINLNEATNILKLQNSKIIWLGTEPIDYVSKVSGIDSSSIIKINPDRIIEADLQINQFFSNSIFLCYNGNIARHISLHLKNEHDINSYVIKGGLIDILSNAAKK